MTADQQGAVVGKVAAIAWRPTDGDAMQEIGRCRVRADTGLDTENRKPGKRSLTLLSKEQWAAVCAELGAELPWYTRRANLLIEGLDLASTIGREITIGDVRVRIHDETKPCRVMDQQFAGLRKALMPDCRGGVFGQVLNDGTIDVGNTVALADG
ncbi:MAG: MOSC domain-containing protein [Planctomycetes bacterium]|nr:MOSC domain-containing protein [Planctomycetota bacterium]